MLGSLVLLVLAVRPFQDSAGSEAETPELCFELDTSAFGDNAVLKGDAFAILSGDADLDGDPDLLVNWHVFAPPVLLWNQGGRFSRGANPRPWSLPEHRDVPILDGPKRAILDGIKARDRAGIYLWHSNAIAAWFFELSGPLPEGKGELVLRTNRPIRGGVFGLESGAYESDDEHHRRVPLTSAMVGKPFYVATSEVGIRLEARLEGVTLPFFVGPCFVELAGPLDFWFRDPHGMAWLDATGDRVPELYVTRGALRGGLAPPDEPKFDDLYVASGGSDAHLERAEVPGDYARGRASQWIDLEGDGRLELYVSAKSSTNRLLRFDPKTHAVSDVAPALGLDFRDADAFAWLDLDGDRDDDLVTLDARNGLRAFRNDLGRHFETLDAGALGLHLAPLRPITEPRDGGEAKDHAETREEEQEGEQEEQEDITRGIDEHDLVLFDQDNDGDLDLLVTGWGPEGVCFLFRAEAGRFVEATESAGLAELLGTRQVVIADFDGDSWLDLLALGGPPRLLRNLRGRLHEVPLPAGWNALGALAGSACDVDGDGRTDVVLAGRNLVLARNRGPQAGGWLQLDVRGRAAVPIGALVRAIYADGSVQQSRVGSTHRGHLSQSHGPIPLAMPEANPLRRVEVLFPGGEQRGEDVSAPGMLVIAPE